MTGGEVLSDDLTKLLALPDRLSFSLRIASVWTRSCPIFGSGPADGGSVADLLRLVQDLLALVHDPTTEKFGGKACNMALRA